MEIKEKEPANEKTLSERSGGSDFHSVDICAGDAVSQDLKRRLWDLLIK